MHRTHTLFDKPISTSNLYTPDFERLCEIFSNAFDSAGELVAGSLVQELEERLCEYHHADHCVAFSTGFWALVASVRLRSIPEKCEVIIPSLTYRRLADVVHWAGKTPVMVDVDSSTLALSCDAVSSAISESTALILGVHPIVNCCAVTDLMTLSSRTGVPIVFDAVESVHETIRTRRVGSFGVGEVFSFHASKLINGIEGGYVCTSDIQFRNDLRSFRAYDPSGFMPKQLGINGVMNDGHAAFALAGLEEIDKNVGHNEDVYRVYQDELRDAPGIRVVPFDESEQTSFKNIVAEVTHDSLIDRDQLVQQLNQLGVLARAHYSPALHAKSYQYEVRRADVSVAQRAMSRFVNLPCGQGVSVADARSTCDLLKSMTGKWSNNSDQLEWSRPAATCATTEPVLSQEHESENSADSDICRGLTLDNCKSVFRQMYDNAYFTNHGPLAQEFEQRLEDDLRVSNVIAVGNESLALLIAVAGLNLTGNVIIPALGGTLAAQICRWLKLTPRFCDVDVVTHQASIETISAALNEQSQAVCLVEPYGSRCDQRVIQWLHGRGIAVIVLALDSIQNFDCHQGAVTVYGFGPHQTLSTLQGGAIAVDDDDLAERYRNIRSSYGTRRKLEVKATCNGRFSEFQAGIGLKSIHQLAAVRARTARLVQCYSTLLQDTRGIDLYQFADCVACFPITINKHYPMTRDRLQKRLFDAGFSVDVGKPSLGHFANADQLSAQTLLLPVNSDIHEETTVRIAKQIGELA